MDEIARLGVLHDQAVLDTPPEARFDRITAMAAAHFKAPIALVSLVDTDRQWFKSCIGLDVRETERGWAFCDHAIRLGAHAVMVVEDATLDARFKDNPLVTGAPDIRFYAGATLTTREGVNLGSLCVIDTEARPTPTEADLAHLCALADLVVDQIDLSRARKELDDRHRILDLAERLSGAGYWTLNTQTGAVFWSPQVYAIHGEDPASYNPALGDALAFYIEEDRKFVSELIKTRSENGQGWDFDAIIARRDGSRRNVRSLAEVQRDTTGSVTGFFGVFKDLTDERKAIETAVEQERRYRLLADNVSDVIATYGPDGVFSYLSPSVSELLGYSPEEMIGRTPYDFMVPEDHARIAREFRQAAKTRLPLTVEYRAVTKDGSVRWLEARSRYQRDENDVIVEVNDSVRDVTERREREVALAEARAMAEVAARTKADFLANMSHEIRTPLNGVLGFAEVLSNTELDQDQRRYLDRIRTAGKGLSALIDDILDFSKIESGKMTTERRAFDLKGLATDVIDLTQVSVAGRLDLQLMFDNDVSPWVMGDEQRTRQVLLNLLGNAAKFTHEGSVTLSVGISAGQLELRVMDTGIGISAEALSRLFQGFTQADTAVGRRFGGTGLGLNISRSLARLMHGDVTLESQPDLGTTAIFSLPYAPAEAQSPPVSAPADASSTRPLRILAVDDVMPNLELLEILLSRDGHAVVCATSGDEAIGLLGGDDGFDLVLMDVQMPGMDGLAATRLIRAMDNGAQRLPVVALTANVMADQIEACRAAGMDDHLGKPIKVEELLSLLSAVAGLGDGPATTASEDVATQDPLAELKARYRAQMDTFEAEFVRIGALPLDRRADAMAAYSHSIAGTAGSFGFTAVSNAAFELEAAAKRCRDLGGGAETLDPLVRGLISAVEFS
ncbi:PAS domain-containing protein [Brevundimonas sp.]|uniref:PAS domain-containing protein n=1 Tax=Brevundimonas sp. TaxID=1871086 RepID=UPI001A29AB68|nr:PAS domain-containing protein [Brevundimonas sp.]MBJ7484688.1 PAS domain-containing protein [Brevundimonas sp.]